MGERTRVLPFQKTPDICLKKLERGSWPESAPVDYTNEELYFESGPHLGDLGVNVAAAVTLIWLPLTIAAVGRAAFVKYRFSNMRLSVITNAPFKSKALKAAEEVCSCPTCCSWLS